MTGKTVIILKGEKVRFPKIEIGMRAVVKGYKYGPNWYATLVILQKPASP
ncbi:MAG: hypothetical protein DDT22_01346 [candidate division WS2 bacterium]|nr:hypothetical protein [Candidatus Lithacetigena glycinireducens]